MNYIHYLVKSYHSFRGKVEIQVEVVQKYTLPNHFLLTKHEKGLKGEKRDKKGKKKITPN